MPKATTSRFVVELPLMTEPFQEDVLNRRLEIARGMYNALLTVTMRRYKEMTKTRRYRTAKEKLAGMNSKMRTCSADERKPLQSEKGALTRELIALRNEYRINENAFQMDIRPMQHHFNANIDCATAQKIASRLWCAYKALLYGESTEIHFKSFGSFNSLESKSDESGIKLRNGCVKWRGLSIPVKIDQSNEYEIKAMDSEIAFCRIVRKRVRGKNKFYLQIVYKGYAPVKTNMTTGKIKHPLGIGDVGLDIGTQTLAVASKSDVKLLVLADRVQSLEEEKFKTREKMERSRKAMNPSNYNEDGTIKKQQDYNELEWNKSNRFLRYQSQLHELCRKQAAIRRQQHQIMANMLLPLGDKFFVEMMDFDGLKQKVFPSGQNKQGNVRSQYGRSIEKRGPAKLLSILDKKLQMLGTQLVRVDTWAVKASQYNHIEDSYVKKPLYERWKEVGGSKVQRDLYSAFLLMCAGNDLRSIDRAKCFDRFDNFLSLHDIEVQRLAGQNNLCSMGV